LNTSGNVLRRHWRLISFILCIIVVFWLLYALRSVVFPFIIGLVLAYLLVPLIAWLERKLPGRGKWQQGKRISLIILVFIVVFGLLGLFAFYIVTAIIDASLSLVENAPQYIGAALQTLQQWAEGLREQFPAEMRQQIDTFIVDAGVALGNGVRDAFLGGVSRIPSTFGMLFGFAALPIFLFYILKDSEKLRNGFYAALSPWIAEHVKNIFSIIDTVLGRWIRAQLLLGFIVAYLTFVGLLVLQIPFAPALAVFAGLTELIPAIGPWIGSAAAVIVTLAVAPEKAIWVAVLFLAVQLLENNLLVPRIQGGYLRINPAILIVLLVVGVYVAGFWGLILAAPLTATLVALYKYMRQSAKAEEVQQFPPLSEETE
jgi:predicted PurR-regulated permease PerM